MSVIRDPNKICILKASLSSAARPRYSSCNPSTSEILLFGPAMLGAVSMFPCPFKKDATSNAAYILNKRASTTQRSVVEEEGGDGLRAWPRRQCFLDWRHYRSWVLKSPQSKHAGMGRAHSKWQEATNIPDPVTAVVTPLQTLMELLAEASTMPHQHNGFRSQLAC
ncbi:unnamed protein product [Nezara viridula]|uniref:Uncharacterized protein n=1 Tax=Nezara viridula TaxID=85310 RepID=A0A9P0DZ16_NEZVI|nr:unnamed protein product [Nezara viridula]